MVEELSLALIQKDKKIKDLERDISKDAEGFNEMSDLAQQN